MKYAVSDIHGCYDKFAALLERLSLGEDDTLYVIGDIIDRGPEGFRIMLEIADDPRIVCIRGNHEDMSLSALESSRETGLITDEMELWFFNGGEVSLVSLYEMNVDDAETVINYMRKMPLYIETEAGGRNFILVHGGLGNYSPEKELSDYEDDELLWARPCPEAEYYDDRFVVFGHTPTVFTEYFDDTLVPGKIFRKNNWADIDCGCVYGSDNLGCLCLDTMEEIYV